MWLVDVSWGVKRNVYDYAVIANLQVDHTSSKDTNNSEKDEVYATVLRAVAEKIVNVFTETNTLYISI